MISIVVPLYRNALTLEELGRRVAGAMEGVGEFELILVVDCSPDASGEVARGMALRDGRVKVVELGENVGQNRSVLVGMGVSRGEIVVVMDGDLQDLPEDVPELVEYLRKHMEVKGVCARRVNRYSGVGRFVTGRVFKAAIWAVSMGSVPRNGSLFMAVRGEVAREAAAWRDRRVHVLSLVSMMVKRGEMRAIPLRRAEGAASGYTGGMRMKVAWAALRTVLGFPPPAEKRVVVAGVANVSIMPGRATLTEGVMGDVPEIKKLGGGQWVELGIIAAVLMVLRLLLGMAIGWNMTDEAWLLQVVTRNAHGEALYRDVFYGAMPLPVYVARGVCAVFGHSALAMKGLYAAFDVGVFLTLHQLLVLLGRPVTPWKLGLFTLLFPLPLMASLYSDLATLFFLLAAVGVVKWWERPALWRAAMIGAWTGLCIASKQNIGVYVMAGVGVTMVMLMLRGRRWRVGDLVVIPVMAAVVTLLTLVPIALDGSWHDMVVLGFTNKSNYMKYAGVNFFQGFWLMTFFWPQLPRYEAMSLFLSQFIFPVTLLAGVFYILGLARGGIVMRKLLIATPLVGMMVLMVFPRADAPHAIQAFPAVVVVMALGSAGMSLRVQRWLSGVAVGLAMIAAGLLLVHVPLRLMSKEYAFSPFPHTRGILLAKSEIARLQTITAALQAQEKPVFILSVEASGFYLISNLQNPTRDDYQLVDTFPAGEAQRIREMIKAGKIRTAAIDKFYSLTPAEVEGTIRELCAPEGSVDKFELLRGPKLPAD